MFKHNFHNLNCNFIVKHVFLNKTKNLKNSHLKFQIQILIFRFNELKKFGITIFRLK